MKFKDFILSPDQEWQDDKIFHFRCPPFFTATYHGCLDIVKMLHKFGQNFNQRLDMEQMLKKRPLYPEYFEVPIFVAIQNGHSEVAKFLDEITPESQTPLADYFGDVPLLSAIRSQKFDLVKYFAQRTQNLFNCENTRHRYGLIHYATSDYKIFEYIMSFPNVNPNHINSDKLTPLHLLCSSAAHYKIPSEDFAKMIRILATLADKKYLYSNYNNPLHMAVRNDSNEALKVLLDSCLLAK